MKFMTSKSISTLFVCALIIGCATAGTQFEIFRQHNRSALSRLSIGIDKDSVVAIFGEKSAVIKDGALMGDRYYLSQPHRTETLRGTNAQFLVFFYFTDLKASDGAITDDELTPVVFQDNKLIGWGWSFLEDTVQKYEIRLR